jgi:hypothetical protein
MAPAAFNTPTLASVPVSLSPHASGKIIRYALIFEALANIVGIVGILYYADQANAFMAAPKPANAMMARLLAHANKPDPVSTLTVDILVGFVLTLTVPILLCLPNTKRAIESRPTVYALLLAGEVVLTAQFVMEALTGRNGLNPKSCWMVVSNMLGFMLFRVFVFVVKPEWFGSYKEAAIKKA